MALLANGAPCKWRSLQMARLANGAPCKWRSLQMAPLGVAPWPALPLVSRAAENGLEWNSRSEGADVRGRADAEHTMRLTKSTSHAIRILIDCAHAGSRLIKVAEISERLAITPRNVFKIVNLLARAGLITALRGR